MVKRIDALTKEQTDRFDEWKKKWVDIGLSTEPADFNAAEEAALKAYKLCGLEYPLVVLRAGSPYAATLYGAMAWMMLREISNHGIGNNFQKNVDDQVWYQVWNQVSNQIRDQVWDQVSDQVWNQIRDQVWSQVSHQVRNQVGTRVSNQVEVQVWIQVWNQVSNQILAQVRNQVSEQVWGRVWDQFRDQVWNQIRDQVWSQVSDQVWDQVWDQVSDQVWNHVWSQVRNQVRIQVWNHVRNQVEGETCGVDGDDFWKVVRDGVGNDGISSMWCSFAAYVTFLRDVCGWENDILEKFEINETLVKSCGWTWWHKSVLVISDRPSEIHRDAEGRLHSGNGPSIAYRDGWSLYHWHGVSIPGDWVTGNPPSPKEAMVWSNIEQRRAACELVGWSRILDELGAKVIDKDEDELIGTLLEMDIPESGKERFLRVRCGTGRQFALPVPPDVKTALEANMWTFGLDANKSFIPEVRT